jgi:stringent starvation protein B
MAFEPEVAGDEAGVDADEASGENPDAVEDMADAAAAAKTESPAGEDAPRRPRPSHLTVVK